MLPKIKRLLEEKLEIPSNLKKFLPTGYQKIGDIIIISLHSNLSKLEKEIGEIMLNNIPKTRVVCRKLASIKGEKRIPTLKVIAGEKNTETIHRESKCLYKLDVKKLMFAKGNVGERHRIQNQVKGGETIVDMFAGIGYFSIPIAKFSNPKVIYAIDINPAAIKYLKENIKLNKVEGKIIPIKGDCREVVKKLGKIADRVILGFLSKSFAFLDSAFSVLKEEGGIIHYHGLFKSEDLFWKPLEILKDAGRKNSYTLSQILYKGIVKSYAPKVYHVVIDAKFSRNK